MELEEIKAAVDAGKTVHWKSTLYVVDKNAGGYDILCRGNDHRIGLTWQDGKTMNGDPEDFFIAN